MNVLLYVLYFISEYLVIKKGTLKYRMYNTCFLYHVMLFTAIFLKDVETNRYKKDNDNYDGKENFLYSKVSLYYLVLIVNSIFTSFLFYDFAISVDIWWNLNITFAKKRFCQIITLNT